MLVYAENGQHVGKPIFLSFLNPHGLSPPGGGGEECQTQLTKTTVSVDVPTIRTISLLIGAQQKKTLIGAQQKNLSIKIS